MTAHPSPPFDMQHAQKYGAGFGLLQVQHFNGEHLRLPVYAELRGRQTELELDAQIILALPKGELRTTLLDLVRHQLGGINKHYRDA